ncbi:uncharacterized protein J7T54_008449 [Emericellopsis cladophorae]|uniref:Cep57 centrosome microtubule-binding domain-containing protein n=1 Tax=Emericellopsis cladophorae TaxID=2686198 RepID=A0A9P9Y3C1_9HYPO|nr:uncharacterized protein J7T54_008449 [Emericellopsis cladophorae]KAI6782363.1 hypothetical protein J7T54_008449 [Emericellopsis cladophorae]
MDADTATRYRSRILREMNTNRDNPFNSPPSSTGSHGTVTLSSVFSDPEGESTRKLNEDIARVIAPRKGVIKYESAAKRFPDYYSMPRDKIFEDDTDTRPMSSESKENKPPAFKYNDDSTQDAMQVTHRTRAQMQPRVQDESEMSSLLIPAKGLSAQYQNYSKTNVRHPSPLSKVQNRSQSTANDDESQRRSSIHDALEEMRRRSRSPHEQGNKRQNGSPRMSSAKSSLTAVPSPEQANESAFDGSVVRSFFMPDVSHLGDFVTGTLRFSGSMRNGVPVFVKNGKVHDSRDRRSQAHHAELNELEVPEDEERIFVSMDMIREEIVSLQEHYDKVQEYASNLQEQVESLEAELKKRPASGGRGNADFMNQHLADQKDRLEVEVADLQSRLEQAARKNTINEIENESIAQEKDRAVRKLQEACEDINKLTRKLATRERELETSHKQLESTVQLRRENHQIRDDYKKMADKHDALELMNNDLQDRLADFEKEVESLTSDNDTLRRQYQSILNENRSLRTANQNLLEENARLRANPHDAPSNTAREEIDDLRSQMRASDEERIALQTDNDSLVRHNENYYSENKTLRRENTGFERSIAEMRDQNLKLKEDVEFLKGQLDHCRPIPKEDFSARLEEQTDDNMTSAFFLPDITVDRNDTGAVPENTQTQDLPQLPEFTENTNRMSAIVDMTEERTEKSTRHETTSHTQKTGTQQQKAKLSKTSTAGTAANKVAFAVPEHPVRASKSTSQLPNQSSKRRTASMPVKRTSMPTVDMDESTGLLSLDNTTQDPSLPLPELLKPRKEAKDGKRQQKKDATHEVTSQCQSQSRGSEQRRHSRQRSHSRGSQSSKHIAVETTVENHLGVEKDNCPALSKDARRVLDNLCEHKCSNCTVCSRITSHRGVISSTDLVHGKKRVTVPRPVPVTDRGLGEDATMRPAHHPGHALAMVIKSLEDEAQHMQLELTRAQLEYNSSDKAYGRRERLILAESIRHLLKQLEAKNDQIYSLYDVLEGQKSAGQVMSEDEVEMTVLNITGMTVRDVTSGTEQLTWEGFGDL